MIPLPPSLSDPDRAGFFPGIPRSRSDLFLKRLVTLPGFFEKVG